MRFGLLLFMALLLVSCSGSDDDKKTDADYAAYSYENMEALVNEGLYDTALEILQERQQRGMGGLEELRLILRARLEKQDGIGAEATIDRLLARGEPTDKLIIPTAKAYVLQARYKNALRLLTDGALPGEVKQDAYLIVGDVLKIEGNRKGAKEYYQSAIEQDPEDFRGYVAHALLEFESAELEQAEISAATALSKESDDAIVHYAVGLVARYKGELEKAEEHLQQAVNLRAHNIAAYVELAGIYLERGNHEAAEKQLDQVYSIEPENQMARYFSALIAAEKGDLDEAEKLLILSQSLTQNYPPATRAYGLVSYDLGKYSAASRYLRQFLAAVPSDRRVRMALVDSLIERSNGEEALAYLAPVLADTPDDIDANLYAASANASIGDVAAALRFYEKALILTEGQSEEDPEMQKVLQTKIALSRFLSGDNEKAAEQLRKLYAGQPENFDTLVLIANIHLASNDLEAVRDVISNMDKAKPGSVEGYNLKGVLAYRAGDIEEAIRAYDQALTVNAEYFSAIKNRGLAHLAAKNPTKAKADLDKAIEMNAADGQVQAFLGRAYLELGQSEAAARYLEKAEAVFPRSALIKTDHAEALGNLDYITSAIKKAKEAKTLAGGDANLLVYIDELLQKWAAIEAEKRRLEAEARAKLDEAVTKKREEEKQKLLEQQAKEKAEQQAKDAAEQDSADPEQNSAEGEPPEM